MSGSCVGVSMRRTWKPRRELAITWQVMEARITPGYRSRMTRQASSASATRVGDLIREWRTRRRLSQLDLALEAGVSQRHLSFVESGRYAPSRDMVETLSE